MWWAASAWQWAHGLGGWDPWESATTLTVTFVPASESRPGPALQGMLSLAASAVLGYTQQHTKACRLTHSSSVVARPFPVALQP